MRHPHVLQLIMDSLRYWVLEMHVDGFRFDLAATLARELHDVDRLSAFFDIIQQDPVISQVKLIAEPWDVGEGGYQVGNFPPLWSEWNGKYRDCGARLLARRRSDARRVRLPVHRQLRSVRGHRAAPVREHQLHHRARRLHAARSRLATTRSTTRRTAKSNRDGESHNRSWNCGVEGPTDDPDVLALRAAGRCATSWRRCCCRRACRCCSAATRSAARSTATTTPTARTTRSPGTTGSRPTPSCSSSRAGLIRLRHRHPVFCRRRWFQGRPIHGGRRQRHRLVHARRHRDVRRGLAGRLREVARRLPERRRDSDAERARRAARRRQLLRDVQLEPRSRDLHAARGEMGAELAQDPRDR